MERIAEVYASALLQAALGRDAVGSVGEQLRMLVDAFSENRNLMIFFFSPYFSVQEKIDGLHRVVQDADPLIVNFLETLIERHRMPVLFAIQTRYQQLLRAQMQLLPVEVTSAIELDADTVESLGEQIGAQTGRKVELTSRVDPGIIGGIVLRVGNFILDASIANQLSQLRKQVAQA